MKNTKIDIIEESDTSPNEYYKKFFKKFEEINMLSVIDWKVTHLLAYFCKKYADTYNTKYQFKFNSSSPSKCFEIFHIKKLVINLTSDPVLLKEYIDWVFLEKITKAKRRITSISFLTKEETIKEYKLNFLFANNQSIDRTTPLPEKYKSIFDTTEFTVSTYGDLSFISQMSDMPIELTNAFSKIEEMGFDKNILTKII